MESTCATRAVKVLKYLRREVPATISRSSVDELEELPSGVLARLHATSNWDEVTKDEQLRDWLAANPVPAPRAEVSGPLFDGTLVFVQVLFQVGGQPPSAITMADVQTARDYAELAVIPIQRYASQYGPNSVGVSPDIIQWSAHLPTDTFTISDFESWVDYIAQTARESGVSNPCVVILHNRQLPNSAQFTGERDSFHGMTANGNPYCYSLVFGENLNVADNNHTINGVPDDKVYAHNLSHEIAEMTVDPQVGSNPEVCDACAGNCSNSWFDLFDSNGVFMGGTAVTASASGFAFFINAIMSAAVPVNSDGCLAVAADAESGCVYPPPFVAGELLSYTDDGAPGNVANPVLAGFGGWLQFTSLFAGRNALGQSRIYAVNSHGQLLSYQDTGAQGNVAGPIAVGADGWTQFKFLFAGQNAYDENRIYAVTSGGQLLSYTDNGTPGNVGNPVKVGAGGWQQFRFVFAGQNAAGENRIYAVNSGGQLLSYTDNGTPGNVGNPVKVGNGAWLEFTHLFAGQNALAENRIYGVSSGGELFSYFDNGAPGNVANPIMVGFGGWQVFKFLSAGQNTLGQNRIYAVPA
jgi:Tachylectin